VKNHAHSIRMRRTGSVAAVNFTAMDINRHASCLTEHDLQLGSRGYLITRGRRAAVYLQNDVVTGVAVVASAA
jgi:hypothetical protein